MATPARRVAATVLGAGAVLIGGAATASANPGCTAGDITAVESQVAAAMTAYFFTHSAVNDFFSSMQGLPRTEAASKTKAYLAANPQTHAEIKAIRGPVFDLRNRCNIPTDSLIRGVL
jgi:hemophore-related protein